MIDPLRSRLLAAMALAASACQSSPDDGGPRARVAILPLQAERGAPLAKDPITCAVRAELEDGERLLPALQSILRERYHNLEVELLPAEQYDPSHVHVPAAADAVAGRPDVVVAITLTSPLESTDLPVKSRGSWIGSTTTWLLLGIPSYFVDDVEYSLPYHFDVAICMAKGDADLERPDRTFSVGMEPVGSDFADRHRVAAAWPYLMTIVIPPHVVSVWDCDDPNEAAHAITKHLLTEVAAQTVAAVRELTAPAPTVAQK